jgi:hypothetical protein
MKWTVLWKPDAESDLAELWVNATDKAAITAAANRVDILLRRDPLNTGESRTDDDRVHIRGRWTVDSMDCKVNVERVWRIS